MKQQKILGVLGGLGPMSSAYFYQLVTEKTAVERDQDHLDIVISSKASTPDRTAFILQESEADPLPVMIEEANKLVAYGATCIALTCNTAHFFYEKLQDAVAVPILNIGALAVRRIRRDKIKAVGLLATSGTVRCGIYQSACAEKSITCLVPEDRDQAIIMQIIYEQIKIGQRPDMQAFYAVSNKLRSLGAERLILGCTELSLLRKEGLPTDVFLDPLEILAEASIIACDHEIR